MTISAKVIAHSRHPEAGAPDLITLQLRYPKFIHGEFLTHRVFSRNSSSSRAIPFPKFLDDIVTDGAEPVFWGRNQAGMQAHEEVDDSSKAQAHATWIGARDAAIFYARQLATLGVHKQIVNRLLEPFYCINTLVTATEWDNFFQLRDHPDAQPEIRALAIAMKEAIVGSTPHQLSHGEWHLPYVTAEGMTIDANNETLVKISVARCARVSYLTHEGKPATWEDDLKLYDRLVGGVPLHASPAEHQATPLSSEWDMEHQWRSNLKRWKQYRKYLEHDYTV